MEVDVRGDAAEFVAADKSEASQTGFSSWSAQESPSIELSPSSEADSCPQPVELPVEFPDRQPDGPSPTPPSDYEPSPDCYPQQSRDLPIHHEPKNEVLALTLFVLNLWIALLRLFALAFCVSSACVRVASRLPLQVQRQRICFL